MRKRAFILYLAVILFAPLLVAQTPAGEGPKYDVSKEVTLRGTVEEIKEVPSPKGQMGIHLMLRSGTEILEVRLCPNSFLKEFAVVFNKGDRLTITGSKLRPENSEKEVILAREIEFGDTKIVLRDKQGVPVWTWLTKGGSH